MPSVVLNGREVRLSANQLIGKGGEADVFKINDTTVLKLYKTPKDPDYAGDKNAQQGAVARIIEQQRKLPLFPKTLPTEVVAPIDLAYDKAGKIVGYTMPFINNMEVLMRLGDRQYRETSGIDSNQVIGTFRKLHGTVTAIHRSGVVLGDFNDLNVLVNGTELRVVDADSMQFGGFHCHTFTSRFVDPLRCDPGRLVLAAPHNEDSDWYAYFVMLIQSLLYVGPYGGVHRPSVGKRLQHDGRVLSRITVLDKEVVYPKPAMPLGVLPDEVLGYFDRVFVHDERGEFPARMLDELRWTKCLQCGISHARRVCPVCSASAGIVKSVVTVRGTVTAERIFRTEGRILFVTTQGGKLRYLYHENGVFHREDHKLLAGELRPELRFRIQGEKTLLGSGGTLFVLDKAGNREQVQTDTYHHTLPVFDANGRNTFWLSGNQLVKDGTYGGPDYIGDILPSQTLFWTGETMGFGLYQAGQLVRGFMFDTHQRGLNDQVELDALPGQMVDATCVFGHERVWFMVTIQEQGVLQNRCFVFDRHGKRIAEATATSGEDSWLGSGIRGHLAIGGSLYAATDDGIVRVTTDYRHIVEERKFPDTEPFVDAHTQLIEGSKGIYAVSHNREIVHLTIK